MKIPDHAKRMFKGEIFDVYQWEQKMFDGSIATFESIKRPNTVLVIPTQGDKIFISEEEQPGKPKYLTLLGGRQEENEEPLECAKRELLEEAGLESNDWELYKVVESHGKFDWKIYLFIARNCKKTAEQKLDAGEKIEVKTISFEEGLDMILKGDGEISLAFLKMKVHNPEKLEEFRRKLLGS